MPVSNKRLAALSLAFALSCLCFSARAIAQQASFPVSNAKLAVAQTQPGESQAEVQTALAATEANKRDPDAWFNLGIAYNKAGNNQEARNAFQRALKLRSNHANACAGLAYTLLVDGKLLEAEREASTAANIQSRKQEDFTAMRVLHAVRLTRYRAIYTQVLQATEAAIKSNPNYAEAHLAKSHALIGLTLPELQLLPDLSQSSSPSTKMDEEERTKLRRANVSKYEGAASSLERYLQLQPNNPEAEYLHDRLQTIKFYARDAALPEKERLGAPSSEVEKRIKITRKPEPSYTEKAKAASVNGSVTLRLLFTSDGKVKHVLALNDLGYGLTEKAVQAARQIRFEPAIKNGRTVSTFAQVNYAFSIY